MPSSTRQFPEYREHGNIPIHLLRVEDSTSNVVLIFRSKGDARSNGKHPSLFKVRNYSAITNKTSDLSKEVKFTKSGS